MSIVTAVDTIILLIFEIKIEADNAITSINACKQLSKRCQSFIPSLMNIKSNANRDSTYLRKLKTLNKKLKFCKDVIVSQGNKLNAKVASSQLDELDSSQREFQALNDLLNQSIADLQLVIENIQQLNKASVVEQAQVRLANVSPRHVDLKANVICCICHDPHSFEDGYFCSAQHFICWATCFDAYVESAR